MATSDWAEQMSRRGSDHPKDFLFPFHDIYPAFSIRDIKICNKCLILIQVMGIINAKVTLQDLGEKQKVAVSDQKKIPYTHSVPYF